MQLRKLTVYGKLRQFLGQSHFEVAVNNPKQAISFLIANFPEVAEHMANQFYKIKMGDLEISEDLVNLKGDGDIKIIPIAVGAGPLVPIITGIGALAGSAAVPAKIFGSAAIGTAVSSGLSIAGSTLISGGVGQIIAPNLSASAIAPTPQIPAVADISYSSGISGAASVGGGSGHPNDPNVPNIMANFGFNSITNVTRAGVPVPIIYGEVFTGSIVISSGIDTIQITGTA